VKRSSISILVYLAGFATIAGGAFVTVRKMVPEQTGWTITGIGFGVFFLGALLAHIEQSR
jgi:hypothetical protein